MNTNQLEQLIYTINNDMHKTLKTNLSIYFNSINQQNKLIDSIKDLLFNLPEYKTMKEDLMLLQKAYDELDEKYNNLISKNTTKNIVLNISEPEYTDNLTNIVPINISNNEINKIKEDKEQEEDKEL